MSGGELEVLERAHRLFAAGTGTTTLAAVPVRYQDPPAGAASLHTGPERYRHAARSGRDALRASALADRAATAIFTAAGADHRLAHARTAGVVADARADAAPDNPLAAREAARRRAARLRAQHAHVLTARRRARRHLAALHALRYPRRKHHRHRPGSRALPPLPGRAGHAVAAALSRLGRPYVWGATGPDRFDCSGLTQWAYSQAGIHLHRTTYEQIHDGVVVSRQQVRPGDLVFPNPGHVQLAIGNNLVVEAPHSGAVVRISPLGAHVAIRRPLP